ncbi:hypothetical protein SB816_05925 [Achromobacter sp. SIMBA_011]|uniref:hypothetical protein n=1 Tax=Achromobacter sp. SIMBA_011 TaxID=3085759 RepID=UPI00397D9775
MSRSAFALFALAAAVVAGMACAASPPAGATPTPAGATPTPAGATPPPLGAMPPPAPDAAASTVAQGQVQRLLMNPYGEVDGLRLVDGTVARFPPHLSQALSAAVKPGDAVRIIGRPQSRGNVKADAIVNTTSGQTVYDQPPAPDTGRPLPPHLRAQALRPQRVEGQVDTVLTGPRGEANGVILTDGSIVRFPPESLRLSVLPGASFAADGLGTRNALGTSLEAIRMGTSLSALQPLYDRAP